MVAAFLHLDKAKALRSAGLAIDNDMNGVNLAGLCEQVLQFSFSRLKRQISDIEFLLHAIYLF